MHFSRIALITGRPLDWDTQTFTGEHAKGIGGLFKWCLSLPDVSLGMDSKGIALILRSVYEQLGMPLPGSLDAQLDRLGATREEKATELLCELWEKIEQARDGRARRLFGLTQADGWSQRARYIRYRIDLFLLGPKTVPLPRTLCVLRYKGKGFFEYSSEYLTASGQLFDTSLKDVGFEDDEVERLDGWLSGNQEEIREMSVRDFADALKRRG